MLKPKTWALVSNGVRARVLRGLESSASDGPEELIFKSKSTHLQNALADRSGRSFASDGSGRRSAMDAGSDPIFRDMQDFAHEILGVLRRRFKRGEFRQLAVFASPRMIGILRADWPPDLGQVVVFERVLNLVGLSEAELRRTVRDVLKEEHLC